MYSPEFRLVKYCFVDKEMSCLISSMSITENNDMSMKLKWSVLLIKDKQVIISRFDKREIKINLAFEFGINKQQDSNRSPIYARTRTRSLNSPTTWRHAKDCSESYLSLPPISSWIRPCTPGLFSRGQMEHQFQARFFRGKRNISLCCYGACKWQVSWSWKLQSINWLVRQIQISAWHKEASYMYL